MFRFLLLVPVALVINACGESKEKQVQVERDYSTRTDVVVITPMPRHQSPTEYNHNRPTPQERRDSHGQQTNVQAVIVNPQQVNIGQHQTGFPTGSTLRTTQNQTVNCTCYLNYNWYQGTCRAYRQGTIVFAERFEVYASSCRSY